MKASKENGNEELRQCSVPVDLGADAGPRSRPACIAAPARLRTAARSARGGASGLKRDSSRKQNIVLEMNVHVKVALKRLKAHVERAVRLTSMSGQLVIPRNRANLVQCRAGAFMLGQHDADRIGDNSEREWAE